MSGLETQAAVMERPQRPRLTPAAARMAPMRAPRFSGQVFAYFAGGGVLHLTLIALMALFLFPFMWMFATSVKTDEEVLKPGLWPTMPTWRGASPYVREPVETVKPALVPLERWQAEEGELKRLALKAVLEKLENSPQAQGHAVSAASVLHESVIAKLGLSAWSKGRSEVQAAYAQLVTPAEVSMALSESLARLELLDCQIRTLDARIFRVASGQQMAQTWKKEAGSAALAPDGSDATEISYAFASREPFVLGTDFDLPVGMSEVHRILISIRPDDSWHRVDATLDVGQTRWVSQRTTYLAQHRPMSIILQPPTYDDQTMKQKLWVPLKAEPAPEPTGSDRKAVLRLIIRPSSTAEAIFGKIERNYDRAFHAVPFWTYVRNSVLLVALTVLGTLFSSTFVAYGFARLNWPGRSVAFLILLCTMMLPAQVTMIPSFLIWRSLGWYNTLNPMWVPAFFGNAFFIFLMVQHMKTIPRELEESARIDGLSALQTWYYIILPQVKPAAAAIAIMTFMGAWNEFMGPLIYLRDQSRFPLSLGLFGLRLENLGDWSLIMAGNVLMTLPVIVIFFLCQRYFVEGVTMSGMKA